MTDEQMLSLAIADPRTSGPQSMAAFGMSVFVSDAFIERYLAAPRPHLAARIYEEIAAGRSPLLDPEAVRQANAGAGLNLVMLHYCQHDWDFAKPKTMEVLFASHASVRLAHEGYRVRRVFEEAFAEQRQLLSSGGLLLKSDFADAYGPDRPERLRSWLYGLYREDVQHDLPGPTVSFLFHQNRPRFGLSPAEQRVLLRAIVEENTDQEIADELGVSADAIKQVWRRVYERVTEVEPQILGSGSEPELTRGNEKRRRVLAYLRAHLEELRPWPRARKT